MQWLLQKKSEGRDDHRNKPMAKWLAGAVFVLAAFCCIRFSFLVCVCLHVLLHGCWLGISLPGCLLHDGKRTITWTLVFLYTSTVYSHIHGDVGQHQSSTWSQSDLLCSFLLCLSMVWSRIASWSIQGHKHKYKHK